MNHSNYPPPTPYRISTITATGSVGTIINLDVLYTCIDVVDNEEQEGIVYVEYGKKKSETIFKGYAKKFSVNRRKTKPTKRFDNQVTIVYRTNDNKNLNIKTFRNGNVQITGIKSIDQGYTTVDKMIKVLTDIYHNKDENVIGSVDELRNHNYKIRLINTDYKVGFSIKRENLHKILKNEYGNVCNYEPVIYPGVKLHYFFNIQNADMNGVCKCSRRCHDLKGGEGNGDCDCKKITIAIFQSGCVIITGPQTKQQIEVCYKFINDILYDNIDKIEKKVMVPPELIESSSARKIVLIPKSKIRYM